MRAKEVMQHGAEHLQYLVHHLKDGHCQANQLNVLFFNNFIVNLVSFLKCKQIDYLTQQNVSDLDVNFTLILTIIPKLSCPVIWLPGYYPWID